MAYAFQYRFYVKITFYCYAGCALKIGDDLPSELCIRETTNILARYASICQQV